MCTVVLSLRPGHPWPLLLAANRDERVDRPWDPPAAHWPGRPGVVAGRDRLGGGTWMAMRNGLVAAVLNRPGSLGPAPDKLSRGDLPLQAV
ncbi:MAG TPA: NRDE family protein, partial [Acetobacteraceae bacterium]